MITTTQQGEPEQRFGDDAVLAGGETAAQALARAQAAAQASRFGEAGGICNDVLAVVPDHPAALALLGSIAGAIGEPARGALLLGRAVQLRPGKAVWHGQLGALYRVMDRLAEAQAALQEAIRLDPSNADLFVALSLVLTDLDDHDRAAACLLRALGLNHDHADAHLALGQVLLARGDFQAGWLEYEWRNLTEAGKTALPPMSSAPWNGMRIPNGRLLLVGDQGYGDTIQFARFIPMAAERVQEVVLGCSGELAPLLRDLTGVGQFHARWNDIPGHAVHCRLSSLPHLLGIRSDAIPARVPYLRADPARVAVWRARLNDTLPPGVKRIGLSWSGRPTHPNDRRRSMPLSRLLPLAQCGAAAFVALQKPVPEADRAVLSRFPGMAELSDSLFDFGETAAVIESLDLVITVDTAVAHLAGALGRPVWVMIPKTADWRWMRDREDSPWYPTARLFRQSLPGAWDDTILAVCGALTAWLRSFAAAPPEAAAAE